MIEFSFSYPGFVLLMVFCFILISIFYGYFNSKKTSLENVSVDLKNEMRFREQLNKQYQEKVNRIYILEAEIKRLNARVYVNQRYLEG